MEKQAEILDLINRKWLLLTELDSLVYGSMEIRKKDNINVLVPYIRSLAEKNMFNEKLLVEKI